MKVPFNYLPYQFYKTDQYFKEWKKLIKSSEFTLGSYVEKFEKLFSKYIGVKHCISTNNGTDALILSLKAIGIKNGDEVITVCNSFYATTGAIVEVGAKPVFVDSDDRYQINVEKIEEVITKRTKAILPVHWGGASPDMKKIIQISKKYNLKIIEDACMGIGAKLNSRRPGTFGEVNAFSMHPLKSLNVMGDGGMVVTNSDKIANWLKKYRNHGMIDRDNIEIWGINNRLQPLQAVVAIIELKKVDQIIKKRNLNAKILDKHLLEISGVKVPPRVKNFKETFALYMCQFEKRDKLKKFLEKNNIEVKIHYPIPLHLQKPSLKYGYKKNNFPTAEAQAKKLLTLPVHQYLTRKQLFYMVKKIKEFYSNQL
jgi:aminotransferase EvaB